MKGRREKQNKRMDECTTRQDFCDCALGLCVLVYMVMSWYYLKIEWFGIMAINMSLR